MHGPLNLCEETVRVN